MCKAVLHNRKTRKMVSSHLCYVFFPVHLMSIVSLFIIFSPLTIKIYINM